MRSFELRFLGSSLPLVLGDINGDGKVNMMDIEQQPETLEKQALNLKKSAGYTRAIVN